MEKDPVKSTVEISPVRIHACFEELETLRFLSFLDHKDGRLLYKGTTEEQSRKAK